MYVYTNINTQIIVCIYKNNYKYHESRLVVNKKSSKTLSASA